MEYVKDLTGFSEVAGTDGVYLQNGEIVVRADNGKVIKTHVKKSGSQAGLETYRLRLKDGRRASWTAKRVFGNKTSNAELVRKIIELNNQGLNDQEIAKILNVTPSTVCANRKRHGIKANASNGRDGFDLRERVSQKCILPIARSCHPNLQGWP